MGYNAYTTDVVTRNANLPANASLYGIYAAARWMTSFNNGFDWFVKLGPAFESRTVSATSIEGAATRNGVVLLLGTGLDYNITSHFKGLLQITSTSGRADSSNSDLNIPATFRFNVGFSYLF